MTQQKLDLIFVAVIAFAFFVLLGWAMTLGGMC